ncbi:hypothetical protein GW17_00017757 [Ensete ventricosum]|nr:hypothetical protein GW17_00017757 [Ensete ventricosum]RZR99813.1 hypothetical protein BHM03_00029429 [Ensete ventricosum]
MLIWALKSDLFSADPEMQHEIDTYISAGRAIFDVKLWVCQSCKRLLFSTLCSSPVMLRGQYLVSHALSHDLLCRLRDIIVLTMRCFQSKVDTDADEIHSVNSPSCITATTKCC